MHSMMMHSSRIEENRKEMHSTRSSHTAEHARNTRGDAREAKRLEAVRLFKKNTAGSLRRYVAKRFMSASNSSRPTRVSASGVRALASGFDPGACVLRDCGCDCDGCDEPGVGASSGATRRAQPRASRAQKPAGGDAEVSRSGHSSRPSRVLGVDPAGSSKEDADFLFAPTQLRAGRPATRRPRAASWTAAPSRARRRWRARTRRRRRRAPTTARGGKKGGRRPPAIDPGSSFCSSSSFSGAARARTRRSSPRPWSRGRASRRGRKRRTRARLFLARSPSGDVRSASFSWSASWTAKARSFRTARALSPAWSFQDSPATHRNRRRRTARSTDSYGPGAPRLCSAWHSATTPSTRVKSSSTSRAFSHARVALSRIASRRHRSGTFTSEASEDALRSRSVRLRAARARFSSASSASSPC